MPKRNPIWNYFDKNEAKAKCRICSKDLSLGSSVPKKQTTTNIKNHLEKLHVQQWNEYSDILSDLQKEVSKVPKLENVALPHTSQATLPEIFERRSKALWPDDHPISRRIDKSIMDLIIVDMLPYSIVEGSGFQRLNFEDPGASSRYRKKSEKFFRTTLMPETYERVKSKVFELVSKAEWISFTTDVWSNPTKTCSLLSFTAHFVVGPKRLKVILGAMVLDEDHTGAVLADKLLELAREYHIEKKIHMAIRDNAANMGAATRIANFTALGCVAHTLQLVIHDALFKQVIVKNIITKCRKIVGHFKKSEQASRYLNRFQETCSLPKHTLVQDVETRWNSTYLMLERLSEQRSAINLYMVERGGIETPTVDEWEIIKNLVVVLKSFYQATLDISADSASISLIIPLVAMLNQKLHIRDETTPMAIINMKQQLSESLNRRFSYVQNFLQLSIATMLDPRFKTKYLTTDDSEKCKIEICNFLRQYHAHDTPTRPQTPRSDPVMASASSCGKNAEDILEGRENLWESHDDIQSDICVEMDPFSPFENQLISYLKEPLVLRNADIFVYWNSSPYTFLKPAADKYLSAPPTSVASEQLFSAAGQLYADRRSNLQGENAEKLLFLAYNIKLFNFDY